jgi:hypothetical protein
MKKSRKVARSINPIERYPVIAVRVSRPLYRSIVKSAKDNDRTMSQEMAALLHEGLSWRLAFEAALLDRGFQRVDGTAHWIKARLTKRRRRG